MSGVWIVECRIELHRTGSRPKEALGSNTYRRQEKKIFQGKGACIKGEQERRERGLGATISTGRERK